MCSAPLPANSAVCESCGGICTNHLRQCECGKLIGAEIGKRRGDKSIIFNGKETAAEAAYSVKAPADAKVIATYADNTPAAFERKVGKGSVVYFAVEPFRSARQINNPGEWGKFLAKEMTAAGERLDHKFWDFMIPKAEKK